jgi:hypothetical protein
MQEQPKKPSQELKPQDKSLKVLAPYKKAISYLLGQKDDGGPTRPSGHGKGA